MITSVINRLKSETNWFDIFSQESISNSIKFRNNALEVVNQSENSGIGIRLNKAGKTGFSYTNEANGLEKCAERALNLSEYGDSESFSLPEMSDYPKVDHDLIGNIDKNSEVDFGWKAIDLIKSEFPDADIDVYIGYGKGKQQIINSEGIDLSNEYSSYSGHVSALLVDEEGSRIGVGYGKSSTIKTDLNDLPGKIIQDLKLSLKKDSLKSGVYPIVFTPKAMNSMLSIILSGFSAVDHYKKISPFCEKMGEKVFAENFSIEDNPLIKNSAYSYNHDDEGIPASKKYIIKNGVAESFVSDLKYASLTGTEPTGNGLRGFSSSPSASFSNIIIPAGNICKSEMFSNIKEGILVDRFLGLGQSNTITGDFSANLDLAYAVRNGEITGRIKDCMISGNIYEMLKGSLDFSMEIEVNGSTVLPYILFEKVNFTS